MPDDFRSLSGIRDALWNRLEQGVNDAGAPARHLAMATHREDGAAVRLVVLRQAERTAGLLTFYTHAHSGKVQQLERAPRAELLLWDPGAMFQARLTVDVTMTPGSRDLWESLTGGNRLNYATDPLPGTLMADPGANAPTPDPGLMTVLTARIDRLDLLHLGALPHARAVFSREDDFRGHWIAP